MKTERNGGKMQCWQAVLNCHTEMSTTRHFKNLYDLYYNLSNMTIDVLDCLVFEAALTEKQKLFY